MSTPPDPDRLHEYLDAAHALAAEVVDSVLRVSKERDLDATMLLHLTHDHLRGVTHVAQMERYAPAQHQLPTRKQAQRKPSQTKLKPPGR